MTDNPEPALPEPPWDFISEVVDAAPEAMAMIRRNGFVFATPLQIPDRELDGAARWERLAFTLYSRLVALSSQAEQILDEQPIIAAAKKE